MAADKEELGSMYIERYLLISHLPARLPACRRAGLLTDSTYVLTACSRVLLEKLTSSQLVKKFLTFHGTGLFITAFASALLILSSNLQMEERSPILRVAAIMLDKQRRHSRQGVVLQLWGGGC